MFLEEAFERKGFGGGFLGRSPQTMDVVLGWTAALLTLLGALGER